jgi:hypothetical protein
MWLPCQTVEVVLEFNIFNQFWEVGVASNTLTGATCSKFLAHVLQAAYETEEGGQ